ncbi:G2/mitotic-specific cyclin-B3-like [Latimeria chalumnae]
MVPMNRETDPKVQGKAVITRMRPAILRSSSHCSGAGVNQNTSSEHVSGTKLPTKVLNLPLGSNVKRTTLGDLTNSHPLLQLQEEPANQGKVPRKQPMRVCRDDSTGSGREDVENWCFQENSLWIAAEVVTETQSLESEVQSRERGGKNPSSVASADRDALDDDLFLSVYENDIFNYMIAQEKKFVVEEYMHRQPQITPHMRAVLVDWMVEVQGNFELSPEPLYLAVRLVDCFLSHSFCPRDTLQLLGATALLVAAKFEEYIPPYVDDFLYICDDIYTREELLEMEKRVLYVLDFNVNIPTAHHFLCHLAKFGRVSRETRLLASYVCESAQLEYQYVEVWPSGLAAASLCLALAMKDSLSWRLKRMDVHSGYSVEALATLVTKLNETLTQVPDEALRVIHAKYSHTAFFEVAKTPSLTPAQLGELTGLATQSASKLSTQEAHSLGGQEVTSLPVSHP